MSNVGSHKVSSILSFETTRLRLRQLAETDLDDYAAMCADAEVMKYVGNRVPLSRDDAWRQLSMLVGHWTLRNYGMWAVEELSSGRFIGRVGLHFPEGWPDREIGWTLSREYWGRGYAYEAAAGALRVAFETLGWPRAISLIAPLNRRSINLAKRLGERFERSIPLGGHTTALYAITQEQWREPQKGT